MECVAFHVHQNYIYLVNYTMSLIYPNEPGLPVLTLDKVSLSEHDGIQSACVSGPIGVYAGYISSSPAVLTVHSELINTCENDCLYVSFTLLSSHFLHTAYSIYVCVLILSSSSPVYQV